MYTFGKGKFGALGHNDKKNHVKPKAVQFFKTHNLKVVDVAVGERFTLAVTGMQFVNSSRLFRLESVIL